jgi:EAL domain-containing protein (putative c-di-GMP-specific phosphodiesterase class I)/FixJ family two-component response regulator
MEPKVGRILIFDDDLAVGAAISEMISYLEMSPLPVTNSEDFFKAISDWSPTHILLDLIMPEMDGVEVLQHLARIHCKSPIALLSGANNRILKAAQRSGSEHGLNITHVLRKPVTVASLEEFLRAELATSSEESRPYRQKLSKDPAVSEGELRAAIDAQQFFLCYQPIIHCNSQMLKGFEVLVRWQHPARGVVFPDQFIPLAESLGLIDAITEQIVKAAFNWLSEMPRYPDLSLSINVSARTFGNVRFPDQLGAWAQDFGISPESVILEVTETAAMEDQLQALDLFTRLRVKGFQVSIDDFGIGNSSLMLLASLPFSEIKVDKTFAISAKESDESRTIIKSTVDLSHNLGLSVVTEGVEDAETLEYLRLIGCDYAQGYYIARPMLGEKANEWIQRSSRPLG